jgi:3-oxoadipate enol-lactonase
MDNTMEQATHIETGIVQIDGRGINYEMRGEGHPLLLIHGGLGDMRMWDDQVPTLAEHFRVIRFDLAGFGHSDPPAGDLAYFEEIGTLLDALGIKSAYLVGVSLGGRIEMDFAIAHPDRVDALVLVAPGLSGYSFSPETMARINEADELLEAGETDKGVELELRLWIDGQGRSPDQVDGGVRERVREMNAGNYTRYLGEETPEGDLIDLEPPAISRLGEIQVPTLVIIGDSDVPDMQAIADQLAADIPKARKVVIENAAHHPQMEHPEAFNRIVLEFLQSQ